MLLEFLAASTQETYLLSSFPPILAVEAKIHNKEDFDENLPTCLIFQLEE